MTNERGDAATRAHASLAANPDTISDIGHAVGRYSVTCTDCEGRVLWEDGFDNVIPTAGANDVLNKYFAGSAWTAAIKLSIITAGTATATSTYASPTVTEIASGNLAARLAVTFAAASGRSIAANTVSVVISGSGTVNCAGIMMVEGGSAPATVGDTAGGGVLISAGNFSGGATLANAIACQLNATGAAPGAYSVVLAFTTLSGEDIVRAVRLVVRPAS